MLKLSFEMFVQNIVQYSRFDRIEQFLKLLIWRRELCSRWIGARGGRDHGYSEQGNDDERKANTLQSRHLVVVVVFGLDFADRVRWSRGWEEGCGQAALL